MHLVRLTVEIEYLYPDHLLVVSPNWFRCQFDDAVPDLVILDQCLETWFSDEIETDPTMVRVWCDEMPHPTVLLPKTIWNSEPRVIIGEGMLPEISDSLEGRLMQ